MISYQTFFSQWKTVEFHVPYLIPAYPGVALKNEDNPGISSTTNPLLMRESGSWTTDLITEDLDLAVASVDDRAVPGVVVGVDLEVKR